MKAVFLKLFLAVQLLLTFQSGLFAQELKVEGHVNEAKSATEEPKKTHVGKGKIGKFSFEIKTDEEGQDTSDTDGDDEKNEEGSADAPKNKGNVNMSFSTGDSDSSKEDADNTIENIIGALIGLCSVLGFFGVIAFAYYLRYRKARNHTNMIRDLIEKRGSDLPMDILLEITPAQKDLRRGVLLSSLGSGLILFLMVNNGIKSGDWGVGILPLVLGLGNLLLWKLNRKDR